MDALFLSRLQFALTIGFHFLFPPLSIGLAWLLVCMEWKAWRKGDGDWARVSRFFAGILGLTFAVGVATGIVMEFQFGTNWARYSKFVGDVFGAPLAAEVLFAFFMESTFLGIYLFGGNRISSRARWFSVLMVALGATISAFWILAANSWQQTPAGFEVRNGRAELTSFGEAVFNPSSLRRFFHTIVGCLIAGSFLAGGISAHLLRKGRRDEGLRKTLNLSLVAGLLSSLAALFVTGHFHAQQVARTQPEKFAAMEGLFRGGTRVPAVVFGVPADHPPRLSLEVRAPALLSLMVHHDAEGYVPGMAELEKEGRPLPPFVITFLSFHAMVGLGMFFIGLTSLGVFLMWRRKLEKSGWFLRALVWSIPLPLAACQLGWILAEVGRQPWVVYRVLRTRDAFSANVSGGEVLFSIVGFGLIYLLLGALYLFILVRKARKGPEEAAA
jgi:cytochrome d ubiquinol oxidase subunit I